MPYKPMATSGEEAQETEQALERLSEASDVGDDLKQTIRSALKAFFILRSHYDQKPSQSSSTSSTGSSALSLSLSASGPSSEIEGLSKSLKLLVEKLNRSSEVLSVFLELFGEDTSLYTTFVSQKTAWSILEAVDLESHIADRSLSRICDELFLTSSIFLRSVLDFLQPLLSQPLS